jgi:hypothetical protein
MLTEDQELALIRSVLVETFPGETRRVGKTNLNDIVRRRGQVRIIPMSGASRLEWTEALSLLASAAVLIHQWVIDHGRATGWTVHFHQTQNIEQNVRVDRIEGESYLHVSGLDVEVPPQIAGKLDRVTLEKLVSSFLTHLEALSAQRNGGHDE